MYVCLEVQKGIGLYLVPQCGEIRQINIISRPEQTYATVEFMSRACVAVPSDPKPTDETLLQTSIPAARTKDKKRINGSELTVDLVWQTTLYVTNFPETVEDSKIKELFEPVCRSFPPMFYGTHFLPQQYGPVLDVRWPSKRFKSTRRFCYVQYANAASPVSLKRISLLIVRHRPVPKGHSSFITRNWNLA